MSNPTHEPQPPTQLYAIRTVAERFDVSTDTVRRLIAAGELAAVRIGANVRVPAAEVEAFIGRLAIDPGIAAAGDEPRAVETPKVDNGKKSGA